MTKQKNKSAKLESIGDLIVTNNRIIMNKLQGFLDFNCYLPVIETLTNGQIYNDPMTFCPVSTVDTLPAKLSSLIRLCHFGESVSDPVSIFGVDLLDEMINHKILINVEKTNGI